MSTEHLSYTHFIHNKYFKWYCNITNKAHKENRIYDSKIHEKHHFLPESMGGEDIVILTHREHYLCHELLVRFTTGKDKMKMCFALHTFFHFDYHRPSIKKSILYETHKKMFMISCSERTPYIKPDTFTFKNKFTEDVFIGTRNEFKKYSNITDQEIYNILSKNENGVCWHSKGWGVFNEKESCFSFELPRKKSSHPKIICEYCGKYTSTANYKRWHGENCVTVNSEKHITATQQIRNLNKKII